MLKASNTTKLTISGVLLAVGMLLPFLTGQIPEIGSRLSPLHLPVLLCGFICGWKYGMAVGFVLPLMRSMIFGMPLMMPHASAMAVEMAVYGAVTGLVYDKLPKTTVSIYLSLVAAMLCGRLVWGVASAFLYGVSGNAFSVQIFIAKGFLDAIPAIILQLILIPFLVISINRSKVFDTVRA